MFDSGLFNLPRNGLKPCLLCRYFERGLNNFRVFRALIAESQSNFARSERVKRIIEMSSHRWRREIWRVRGTRTTGRGLHFAVVGDKLDLSLKGGYKKIIFIVSLINQCSSGVKVSSLFPIKFSLQI